jgi:DNA-directed RNA polymerase specialized sigma24 family protein
MDFLMDSMMEHALAFKLFFIRQYPPFYSFAKLFVQDPVSARQVVAEAMFMLWATGGGDLRDEESDGESDEESDDDKARSFLYASIRRNCLNYLTFLQNTPAGQSPPMAYQADPRFSASVPAATLQALTVFMDSYEDDR